MSSGRDVLFTQLKALYTADTGSSGLNSAISTARVHQFFKDWDSNRTDPHPAIRVSIAGEDEFTGIHGASATQGVEYLVAFHFFTHRQSTQQDLVLARFRTVYWRIAPATASNWSYSPLVRRGGRQLAGSDAVSECVEMYSTRGTYAGS